MGQRTGFENHILVLLRKGIEVLLVTQEHTDGQHVAGHSQVILHLIEFHGVEGIQGTLGGLRGMLLQSSVGLVPADDGGYGTKGLPGVHNELHVRHPDDQSLKVVQGLQGLVAGGLAETSLMQCDQLYTDLVQSLLSVYRKFAVNGTAGVPELVLVIPEEGNLLNIQLWDHVVPQQVADGHHVQLPRDSCLIQLAL